jgi:hypothetical protein
MSFTGQVRSASWYPAVKAEMDAAGVPEYLWVSIIRSEDPSLNPAIVVADTYADGSSAGNSYGLFQLNQNAEGTDPVYAGNWAAGKLEPALSALGGSYTPAQALAASEAAAWPGNDPALITKESPARTAALNATLTEMGFKSTDPNATAQTPAANAQAVTSPTATASTTPSWLSGFDPSSAIASAEATAASWGVNILIGVIIFAVVIGGFVLVATNGKAPTVVPVPV